MPNYNVDATGQKLRVNFNENISTGTAFVIELEPRAGGDSREKTATLGTSDVTVDDEKMLANQYIEYTIASGDFDDYIGIWRMKGKATLPSETKVTNFVNIRVMP